MVAKASAKYLRISPFKVRPVIELIKGKGASKSLFVLAALNKKGAYYLKKVLQSAIANAKNKGYDEDKLFVSKAIANPGPAFKRYRAESFGRASVIRKRMSHILIELDTPEKTIDKKIQKVEKKVEKKKKSEKVTKSKKAKVKKRLKHGSKS